MGSCKPRAVDFLVSLAQYKHKPSAKRLARSASESLPRGPELLAREVAVEVVVDIVVVVVVEFELTLVGARDPPPGFQLLLALLSSSNNYTRIWWTGQVGFPNVPHG